MGNAGNKAQCFSNKSQCDYLLYSILGFSVSFVYSSSRNHKTFPGTQFINDGISHFLTFLGGLCEIDGRTFSVLHYILNQIVLLFDQLLKELVEERFVQGGLGQSLVLVDGDGP